MQILKRIVLSLMGLIISQLAFAQGTTAPTDAEIIKTKKKLLDRNTAYAKPSKDFLMLQAGYNDWILGPGAKDSIQLKRRGLSFGAYACYELPLQKKGFTFAIGAGIGSSSVYLDSSRTSIIDTARNIRFTPDSNLKRFKISNNFLEAPIEFRYNANTINRNRGLKLALGMKFGTLVNAHTKAVDQIGISTIRQKESSRRYFEQWRINTTARVGWGNFSVFGNYQLSNVFKQGLYTNITPYSVGLCISGL